MIESSAMREVTFPAVRPMAPKNAWERSNCVALSKVISTMGVVLWGDTGVMLNKCLFKLREM